MYISKETELIVRLLQLPGFGSRSSEIVANCMVKNKAFDEADIYTYIMNCINNKLIRAPLCAIVSHPKAKPLTILNPFSAKYFA